MIKESFNSGAIKKPVNNILKAETWMYIEGCIHPILRIYHQIGKIYAIGIWTSYPKSAFGVAI